MIKLDLDQADINQGSRGPIPAGSIVPLRMKLLPGNIPPDNVYARSAKGDCAGLKAQYTVIEGEHAGRNFQVWHLVEGTTPGHQEARAYTLAKLRAIVDAVRGIDPKDRSAEAVSARTIDVVKFFNGAVFLAELGVEAGGPKTRGGGRFNDKNTLVRVLRLGDDDYRQLEQTAPPPSPNSAAAPVARSNPGDGSVAKPRWTA